MRTALLSLLVLAVTAPAAGAAQPVFRTVTFGDSYASGEGSPGTVGSYPTDGDPGAADPAADWNGTASDQAFTGDSSSAARRCHRSPRATSPQAVRKLAGDFPEISFSFRSFACSGARVDAGILGSFKGAEPEDANNPVPRQITQANDYLDGLDANRRIDALVMNIGGNNLGFGNIIQRCTNLPPFAFNPCSPGDVSFGGNDDTKNVLLKGEGTDEPDEVMGVDDLPGLYRNLDDAIDRRASSGKLGVVPRKVFLTGPPNPLVGGFSGCGTGGNDYEKNLASDERGWLNSFVFPTLRGAISDGASANGWTFVDMGPAVTNGICASGGRMINRNRDSLTVQGATVAHALGVNVSHGWVHPNPAGYTAMSGVLADAMRPQVISTFTPGQPGAGNAAPVEELRARVLMRVAQSSQDYDTHPAAIRPTSTGGVVTGDLGSEIVEVPVPTTNDRTNVTVLRCGPLAPSVAPPTGCGATRIVTNVLTGDPGVPTNVKATKDALGVKVSWDKGSPASRTLRRFLVSAKAILPESGRVNPTDLLSDCPIEDNPALGGDGPLINGRPCGQRLPTGQLPSPIETDFSFGADIREAVLPLAKGSDWSVTVRECTDRGCGGRSAVVGTATSGLTLNAGDLEKALDRASTKILIGDLPLGVFTTLAGRTAKRGATFPLRVAWGAWRSWRDLRSLDIRLSGDRAGELATLRVALPSGKVTLLRRSGDFALQRGSRLAAASSKSRLVALELPLRLSRKLARQRVSVEIAATGPKGKRQDFGAAGAFGVG